MSTTFQACAAAAPTMLSTSPTTHKAKRPYTGSQPQHQSTITSYFQLRNDVSQTLSSPILNTTHSASPPLPALVQSNLLSVGMRVRKSVPEGYKTGLRKHALEGGGMGLFVDSTPPPFTHRSYSHCAGEGGGAGGRELTPFCGIMKVGGMAVQGWDYNHNSTKNQEPEEDGIDGLREDEIPFLSSQGSTISSASVSTNSGMVVGYKRRFCGEEEDQVDADHGTSYDIWRDNNDLQLSPKTKPVDLIGVGSGFGRRAMAVPKSRRKVRDSVTKLAAMEGQENNHDVVDIDFEEAEFLDYGIERWDACGKEVIMRDV